MSENQRQSKTCTVVNNKSQGSVTSIVGFSVTTFLQIYGWVCDERIFEISQHLAKLQARKRIVLRTLCTWALSCWWRTCQRSWVCWETTVVEFNLA